MIRTLIVDDQEDIRILLRLTLQIANKDLVVVGEAQDGREALARADQLDPTVVVLDHMMPDLTGIEVARELGARRPGQRIVLFTAYLDDALAQLAADAGIASCLDKSEISALPGAVRAAAA